MDLKKRYAELYSTVLEEHRRVFEAQDLDELEWFMDAIIAAADELRERLYPLVLEQIGK